MQSSKEIYLRLSIFALIFSPAEKQGQQWIIHPNHYDQRLKALAFTLFKPLCPSYSATP